MAKRMAFARFLVGLTLLVPSFAIYEDQVGQVDWKHDHVGVPTSSLYFSKHTYVVTDQGVIASLNAKTGDIEWRHLLTQGGGRLESPIEHFQFSGQAAQTSLSEVRRNMLTVMKSGTGRRLQMWRTDGSLLWDESTIPLTSGGASRLFMGKYISLLTENHLNVFTLAGDSVWQISEFDFTEVTGEELILSDVFQVDDKTIGVVGSRGSTMVVLHLDVATKGIKLLDTLGLKEVPSNQPFVVTATAKEGVDLTKHIVATPMGTMLHCSAIGSQKLFQVDLSSVLSPQETITRAPTVVEGSLSSVLSVEVSLSGGVKRFIAVVLNAEHVPVRIGAASEQIAATSTLGKVYVANVGIKGEESHFSLVESSTQSVLKGVAPYDVSTQGRLNQVWPFLTEKRDGELFFRILASSSADVFTLMQPDKTNWVRDEALASVKHVVFVGQRLSDVVGNDIQFTGELSDWKARWEHQMARLSEVASLEAVGKDGLTKSMRHKFGLDKDAICLTNSGKLISLSLDTGKVHWSLLLSGSDHRLLVSREHPHGSHNPEVVILTQSEDGSSEAVYIDASQGVETKSLTLPVSISSVTSLGDSDSQGTTSLMVIGAPHGTNENAEPLACLLEDSSKASKKALGSFFHVIENGVIRSYQIKNSESGGCFSSMMIGSSELGDVRSIAYPSSQDHVNAPAQILGDDSLLLKYTNSHLLTVMSATENGVAVSLVDTVAAKVLHRVVHASASVSSPGSSNTGLVMTENMVVYSFWNTKAKRSEIGVLSLYEGMLGAYDMNPFKIPLQDPTFSSFTAKSPVVMQRTFISPRTIKHLSATVTAQGISTKNILATFDGGQIAMIPRRMLDPRRPNTPPTKTEMEEGLFQYHPYLFLDPRGYVTMNQTSLGVERVFVSSAIIESATIVLATGIDTFFTRATPSKTFDLLAADFNHSFLLALLLGLFLATIALRKFDQEKKLNSAWR